MFDKYRANDITRIYMEKYAQLKRLSDLKGNISDEDLKVNSMLNIFIEPTNRCNLNCIFCARENMKRDFYMLDFEALKKALVGLPVGSYISLTGNGEPTLNVKLYDMIRYASEKGMFVSIITNATALNAMNRRKLLDSGVSRVQFSFQSIDKKDNEIVMRGVQFRRTLLNILNFIYEVRTEKKKIYISIARVKIDETKKFAQETEDFWKRMPIDNFYDGEFLSLQTNSKIYQRISGEKKETYKPCVNPWTCVKINANGDVNPCVQDFSSKFVLGNIYNNTLMEILNSEEAIRFRRASLTGAMEYLNKIGYNCELCNTWGPRVKGNIEDTMHFQMPVILGLVIHEISGERPMELEFLKEAIAFLETGRDDVITGLMNPKQIIG